MKSLVLLMTILLLVTVASARHAVFKSAATELGPDEADIIPIPKRTKDLTRTVSYIGNTLHQSVDDHHGQITDQYVGPNGIRNVVHRNGVLVLDQLVTSDKVKQLVP